MNMENFRDNVGKMLPLYRPTFSRKADSADGSVSLYRKILKAHSLQGVFESANPSFLAGSVLQPNGGIMCLGTISRFIAMADFRASGFI
jgi:hypothetical protein